MESEKRRTVMRLQSLVAAILPVTWLQYKILFANKKALFLDINLGIQKYSILKEKWFSGSYMAMKVKPSIARDYSKV